MHVKFWGTRGSLAKPGPATIRYGGNTSCVEVRSDSGTLVLLDCGTGSHDLGQQLCRDGAGSVNGHLLISHTHWDHIQGIPFFAPLFVPGNHWDIYGPKGLSQSLRATLAGQMEHTYFPVGLDQFEASISYHDLVEGTFSVGDIKVTTRYLNHPALTLGYRLEADGASIVYCCDHEPHAAELASGEVAIAGGDRRYADFVAGADLVIHDAQYTASQFPAKVGWGHSSVEYAVRISMDAGVKTVALTHHDPLRDDAAVDRIIEDVKARLKTSGSPLQALAAAEGLSLQLRGEPGRAVRTTSEAFAARTAIDATAAAHPVLVYVSNSQLMAILSDAIAEEGLLRHVAADGKELLLKAIADAPSVVIIEHDPPRADGMKLLQDIRRGETPGNVQVPIVMVSASDNLGSVERSLANDWLVAPFTLSYARSRIRAWVLRTAVRWVRARLPEAECDRLGALQDLSILDTPPEERFDRITRIAAAAFDAPIALVSLVDSERQWFKSCYGLQARETPRDMAFCAHVVNMKEELVVCDTLLDDRFADNPLVRDEPRVRFYAGAPLILEDGNCIGTLCVIDTRPRDLGGSELAMLRDLRDVAVEEIRRRQAESTALR